MSLFPRRSAALLASRPTRLAATFYAMRFVSQAGQGIFLAGLFLLAGTGSRAAAGTSSLLVAMMAASLLGGLPAGSFADRIGPAISIRIGAAGRALAIAVALLVATGTIPGPAVLLVAAIAFVYSATSQLYSPAEMALVAVVVLRLLPTMLNPPTAYPDDDVRAAAEAAGAWFERYDAPLEAPLVPVLLPAAPGEGFNASYAFRILSGHPDGWVFTSDPELFRALATSGRAPFWIVDTDVASDPPPAATTERVGRFLLAVPSGQGRLPPADAPP